MYSFSTRSNDNLVTCDYRIQAVLYKAIEIVDFSVICGRRDKTNQNKAFEEGTSKVTWPDSAHNVIIPSNLSKAVDVIPYPFKHSDWRRKWKFAYLAGIIIAVGFTMGIKLKWGGLFKGFFDGPHIQLDED